MDLLKKLTGKNPAEYENVAKDLVDNSDTQLFAKLVKQDDFLFDFIKNNVSNRIKKACNKDNYQNILNFFEYYSSSYSDMFSEVLFNFGGNSLLPIIKEFYINGSSNKKAYALKYFLNFEKKDLEELIPLFRQTAESEVEQLCINSIELLSNLQDDVFRKSAYDKLKSLDEFEQYKGVKDLVIYKDKEALSDIIAVMKKSSLTENIAAEIPYLVSIDDLVKNEDGILVLCNIVNAIPEIIPPSAVLDYDLFSIFEKMYLNKLDSAAAVLLMLAQDKFIELTSNDEYLYDCDKNTKDEIIAINNLLSGIDKYKLTNLLYDELYGESPFVLFAVDFVSDIEELETLLDSNNQTLVLKVLSILKQKGVLLDKHKEVALNNVKQKDLVQVVNAL